MADGTSPPDWETAEKFQGGPNEVTAEENASTDYACNECRRRKARCTRELPICSVCRRHGRHCLYQRHSRTPLTRKHLTEVEELLRIATHIIAQRLPDIDLNVELERSRNGELDLDALPPIEDRREIPPAPASAKRRRMLSESEFPEPPAHDGRTSDHIDSDLYATNFEGLASPPENHAASDTSPVASLENPPPNNLDYDWDERHGEATLGIDGMAGLSLHEEKPGYVGIASGAALLNLIQSYTSDPFASMEPLLHSRSIPDTQILPKSPPVDLKREIPSHRIARYISDFFSTYHVSYPLVHQGIFMAQYNEIIPRPKIGWMVLMYTVAAIGAFMAATTPDDDDVVLFHLARSHLSVEMLEIGNITLVQSLTLISNYLQKRDRPNSGYNYLGLAVRMAFGLGLHKEFPNSRNNLLQTEIRRRVWWCLYIFDAGSTMTYSRPLGIPSTGIDARLPLNTYDSDLNAGTTEYPVNAPTPTIYTNVRIQSQFHLLTSNLYNRIISKPFPSAKEVLAWDDLYIGKWASLVPDYYKDDAVVPEQHALAHAIMVWRYKNLRMIIYRPFLIQKVFLASENNYPNQQSPSMSQHGGGSGDEGVKSSMSKVNTDLACDRCRKESNDTIRHIDQFWRTHSHTRMASWYALFFLFPAVLVPLMSLHDQQSPLAENWREDIRIATQIIRSMIKLNPSAARFLQVLERLNAGFFGNSPSQMEGVGPDDNFIQQGIEANPLNQMLSVRSLMFPDPAFYGVDGQSLPNFGGSSALGVTFEELYGWTNDWTTANMSG